RVPRREVPLTRDGPRRVPLDDLFDHPIRTGTQRSDAVGLGENEGRRPLQATSVGDTDASLAEGARGSGGRAAQRGPWADGERGAGDVEGRRGALQAGGEERSAWTARRP